MKEQDLQILIERLFSGDINSEEYARLKTLLEESTDSDLSRSLNKIWENADFSQLISREDHKQEVLANLHKQIQTNSKPQKRSLWRYVAAIAIPLIFTLGYLSQSIFTTPETFIVSAKGGQKSYVQLPDGSIVWINSDSELSYNSDFNKKNRRLKLKGEAFFDIQKNQGENFIVELNEIEIEVKGTKFNVSAYESDEQIDITLLEGLVSVNKTETHETFAEMQENQKIQYNKSSKLWIKEECDGEMESLWVNNTLRFEDTPMAKMYIMLERWYGVNISIENIPAEPNRYGFTIKSESLEEALRLINRISPIEYKINGEEVTVKYK